MGRAKRNYFPGGIYHVIQRGHNRSFIFENRADKKMLLRLFGDTISELPCHVLYYVVMNNHYHFVLEMLDDPIDEIMRRVNLAYCKYYNFKYTRSGTVFGGRYTCCPISEEAYFHKLVFYIANNPVKAGLAKHPSEYYWCAHREFFTMRRGLVSRNRLLEILGGSVEKGWEAYSTLISESFDPQLPVLTQRDFVRQRQIEELNKLLEETLSRKNFLPPDLFCPGSRNKAIIDFRRSFAASAIEKGYRPEDIAKLLQINERTIRG